MEEHDKTPLQEAKDRGEPYVMSRCRSKTLKAGSYDDAGGRAVCHGCAMRLWRWETPGARTRISSEGRHAIGGAAIPPC